MISQVDFKNKNDWNKFVKLRLYRKVGRMVPFIARTATGLRDIKASSRLLIRSHTLDGHSKSILSLDIYDGILITGSKGIAILLILFSFLLYFYYSLLSNYSIIIINMVLLFIAIILLYYLLYYNIIIMLFLSF